MADRIKYRVDLDINQQQLKSLQDNLTKLQKMTAMDLMSKNPNLGLEQAQAELKEIKKQANDVQSALSKAFNVKLNVTNFQTLQNELKSLKLDKVYQGFAKAGSAGIQAFNQLPSAVMKTNLQLKESHTILDKMGTTLANSFKWSAASSVVNRMAGSIEGAWNYAKSLDTSLNDIRIVSGKSADEMERFARTANQAAQRLGKSTTDYTNAALIYYQQGLGDQEVQKRAEVTLKTANVTGQSTRTVSEQLTSVWNGYNITVEQSEAAIDKLAAVAASTASDLEELSTGMSKVASAANIMGVDIDQLNAQLATIVSVTRQAPESVGTALKTIYARMGDIEAGLDGETSLDQYTEKMAAMGINVLNTEGKLRDMGEVIEEVGNKWPDMSREQQVALSQIMAGTRQYNNLLSLFNNWDMYENALKTSKNSLGTLEKQQETYMESTKAHIEQLDVAWERVFDAAVDNKGINGLIDIFTGLTNGIANFVEGLGGGANVLATFGSLGTQVFSKQIAGSINIGIKNMNAMKENAKQLQGQLTTLEKMKSDIAKNKDENGNPRYNAGLDARIQERKKLQDRVKYFSTDKIQEGNNIIDDLGTAINEKEAFQVQKKTALTNVKALLGDNLSSEEIEEVFYDGTDASNKFTEAVENNRMTLAKYSDELDELRIAIKEYQKAVKKDKGTPETKTNREEKATKLRDSFKKSKSNIKKLSEEKGIDKETKKDLQDTYDELEKINTMVPGKNKTGMSKFADEVEDSVDRINGAIIDAEKSFDNLANNYDEVATKLGNGEEARLDGAVEGLEDKLKGFLSDGDREAMIDGTVRLAAGFGQMASAAMNISNLGDIITNEDLSTWDKFLQISMNLGTSIPMLINGFSQIEQGWRSLTELVSKLSPKIIALATAHKAQATSSSAAAVGTTALATAETAEGVAATAAIGPTMTLGSAIGVLLAELAPFIAIAAVIGVSAYAIASYFNADADAAKEASENAKALADEHNRVKQELDKLKSSFDAYETAKKKLDSCTKGTQEWRDALKEVNNTAVEVIDNLDILSASDIKELYHRDTNTGELIINKSKMDELINAKDMQEGAAQLAAAQGQKDATDANIKVQIQAQMRKVADEWANNDIIASAIKRTSIVGTAGVYLGQELIANEDKEVLLKNLDKFTGEETLGEFKRQLSKLGVNINGLSDESIKSLKTTMDDLAGSAAAAEEKLKLISQATVDDKLGDKYSGAAKTMAGNNLLSEQEKIKKNIIETNNKELSAGSNAGSAYYKELARRLSNATRGKYSAATGNTVLGWNNNRRFIFQDKNGEKTEEKSLDWVSSTIAASEAMEKLTNNADEASEALNNLDKNTTEGISIGIKSWIQDKDKGLENLTEGDLQKLQTEISNNGGISAYLQQVLGVSEDKLKEMLGPDFINKFRESMNDTQLGFNTVFDEFLEKVQNKVTDLNLSEVDLKGQKNIGKLLQDVFVYEGEEALNATTAMLKKLKPKELSGFAKVLDTTTDWYKIDLNGLKTTLRESGVATSFTDDELQNLINSMRAVAKETDDLTKLQNDYAEAKKAIKGLKIGDTIDKEAYDKLTVEGQSYFTKMLDGTYKLVAGADLLQQSIKDSYMDRFGTLYQNSKDSYIQAYMAQGVSIDDYTSNYGQEAENIKKTIQNGYNGIQQVFGNIDLKTRQVIKWTDANLKKNQDSVWTQKQWDNEFNSAKKRKEQQEQWEKDNQYTDTISPNSVSSGTSSNDVTDTVAVNSNYIVDIDPQAEADAIKKSWKVVEGEVSTVLGTSSEFNGLEIAFSPILQVPNGEPKVLTEATMNQYINGLLDKLQGTEWTADDLLRLDTEGLDIEGQHISNMIAKVGENAQQVGEMMHNIENINMVNGQLSILSVLGDEEQQKQAEEWKEKLDLGQLDTDQYQKIAEGVKAINDELTGKEISLMDKYKTKIKEIGESMLNEADTFKEQKDIAKKYGIDKDTLNIASLNKWNVNREKDLDTDEIKDYARYIQEIAGSTNDFASRLSDGTKDAAKDARDLAVQILRMNDGVETLADNWEDWGDILKKSSKSSQEYQEAMEGTKEALADLLDTDEEFISNDFVRDHLNEITQAAKGSEKAIDSLREASVKDLVMHFELDETKISNDELYSRVQGIQDWLNRTYPNGIQVGARIDMSQMYNDQQSFLDACNQMIEDAGLSTAEVNAMFGRMGFNVAFNEETRKIPNKIPITTKHHRLIAPVFDDKGNMIEWTEEESSDTRYEETTGEYQAFAVGATPKDQTVQVPTITGLRKKASGSANNYSSKNKGGGGPGKKSGGGSSKKPDKMDKVKSDVDRYHKVNTQLDKIGNQLDKIQSQEKKFIGTKLIQNLNGQLEKLDKRIDNLREKQKIAYGEADELRQKLSSGGVSFNDDGTISNYMEMYNSKLNYINSLIDQYNNMSAEEQENFKETIEQAKKDFEQWQKDMDRYDELISDFIPGLENDIQDAIDEEIELNIKKFNLEFEVKLDIADAQKDWNEFKRKILDDIDDDDILGNARARATDDLGVYLSGTDGKDGLLGAGVKQIESILKELKQMDETGWSNVYGDDRVSALEDLQEAYQNVEQSLMEIKQIQEDVAQAVLDQMDAVVDAMDKVADLMDTVDSQIEHDIKVIEMVYGETDYDAKGKYMEKRQQNNLDALGTAKDNRDYWEQQMNLIDDKTSEAYQKAQENFFKYNDAVNEAIEKSIEDAQEKAENAIDGIFKKYNDEITNGKGLDYTEQQWELVNDVADQYLDTVNAAFGIRQLEGKWKDAIDNTDNVGAQRKLNALMEEQLKKLREKDKLTEYDIERAEKEYEIALKKLALEEAQQIKSTMRLRRDSQGNYRYEYVADEDQIAKLQDELDALENSLYNFDKDRWLEMQNQVVDAVRERQEAIKEILMDASLTEEERLERLEEINRLYNEKIQNITDQAVTAQTNLYDSGATELAKIWDEQGKDFQALSDEEKRVLVEEMLPQFETGVNEMIDKFSGPDGFEKTTVGSMGELSNATQEYQKDLSDIEDQAGITFDELRDGQDDVLDKMPDMIDDAEDYVDVTEDELSQLQDINAELQKKLLYYQQISVAAKAAAVEAYNYWLKEKQIAAEKYAQENEKNNNNAGGNNGNTGTGGNGGGSGDGGKTTLNAYDAVGVAAAISLGQNYGGWGVGQDRANKLAAKFTNDNDVQAVINRNNGYKNSKGEYNAYRDKLENYYYNRFNTGGYTGDWVGDYGKFAMLDRKELILNAHDTENMLDMLAITRDVVAMSGPRSRLSKVMTPNTNNDILEQNVHIEANFPNAESAEEIKEAIYSLVNLAAQKANRNGRG